MSVPGFHGDKLLVGTLVRSLQPINAEFPILVTLFGIVTLVREVQLEKAARPILTTLSGIATLARS